MSKKKILFMGGSLNQTTMLHNISKHLTEYEHYFTAYYSDGIERFFANLGLLDFTVLGGKFREQTESYFRRNNLKIDYEGKSNDYDLVIICSDLIIPKNILNKKIILVQEGMTDPENIFFHIVKKFSLPRYFGGTAATGLSNAFTYFCVASEGYRNLFIKKGVKPEKLVVSGIPNFDNCSEYLNNDFPHKNYCLICTSDARETLKFENRKKFILKAVKLSEGKQIIFKLHPNESVPRATREINLYAPGSLIFTQGNTNHMIANCDILITAYSSVVYVGLALGKKVYSEFELESLKKLLPVQNNGQSSFYIANICRLLIEENTETIEQLKANGFDQSVKVTYQTA